MENILVIIDTAPLLYSTCFVCSKDDNPNKDNFVYYKDTFDNYMQDVILDTKANYYLSFGDGYTSFRKQMFATFKGDRVNKGKPKFFYDLKKYAQKKWNIISSNILEADDLCLIHNQFYSVIAAMIPEKGDSFSMVSLSPIIATIDSDLKQDKGNFYNFGYIRSKITKEKAFQTISEDQGTRNLWQQVLMKGHNNKVDYLVNCGKECAKLYTKPFSIPQLKLAVLNAFINGIDKNKYNMKRNVKGYGLVNGIDKFSKAFTQTYLLRTEEEALEKDPEFTLSSPLKIIEIEEDTSYLDNNLIL